MKKTTLITNLQIIKKIVVKKISEFDETSRLDYYFMMFDNDKVWDEEEEDKIYFVYRNKLKKETWDLLNEKYDKLEKLKVEYEVKTVNRKESDSERKGNKRNVVTEIEDKTQEQVLTQEEDNNNLY